MISPVHFRVEPFRTVFSTAILQGDVRTNSFFRGSSFFWPRVSWWTSLEIFGAHCESTSGRPLFRLSAGHRACFSPTIPTDPPMSHKYVFSTHDHGRLRSNRFQSLRTPDFTWSRLSVLSLWRKRVQTAIDPVDSDPEPAMPGPP